MSTVFERPSLWQRTKPLFSGFDIPLTVALLLLAGAGLLTMYSAGHDHGTRFVDHGRNMIIGLVVLFVVAQVPPQKLMHLAVPLYTAGVLLLVATAVFGITKKGATRWLNLGVVIQPSEILKIAMPLMLAWWFQKREGLLRWPDFVAAFALLLALGLEYNIGAAGRRLSHSQRLKLSFARALIRKSDYYIFNRPLSGLDHHLQDRIVEASLAFLAKDGDTPAVVWVLSNTPLAKHFGRVIAFNDRTVAEDGSYETIVENGSVYKQLIA